VTTIGNLSSDRVPLILPLAKAAQYIRVRLTSLRARLQKREHPLLPVFPPILPRNNLASSAVWIPTQRLPSRCVVSNLPRHAPPLLFPALNSREALSLPLIPEPGHCALPKKSRTWCLRKSKQTWGFLCCLHNQKFTTTRA